MILFCMYPLIFIITKKLTLYDFASFKFVEVHIKNGCTTKAIYMFNTITIKSQ
jgi:hypothetical protein